MILIQIEKTYTTLTIRRHSLPVGTHDRLGVSTGGIISMTSSILAPVHTSTKPFTLTAQIK